MAKETDTSAKENWYAPEMRYSEHLDAIEMYNPENGDVVAICPRNQVIKMIGMFPSDPPKNGPRPGEKSRPAPPETEK